MKRFHFLFLWGEKKTRHFWSGRERQSPSPSLALVSTVFVSLASVQDLAFTLFTRFLSSDRFDSRAGISKIAELARLLFLLNAQQKRC